MVDLSGTAGTLVLAAGGAVVAAVALQSESVRGAVNEATGGPGYDAGIQAPEPQVEAQPVGDPADLGTSPVEVSGVTSNARTASPALQEAIVRQSRVSVVKQTGPNQYTLTGD